jgi:hypothetical protein
MSVCRGCVRIASPLHRVVHELWYFFFINISIEFASNLHRVIQESDANEMQMRCKCDATIDGQRSKNASNLHRNEREIRCKSDANYDTNAMQMWVKMRCKCDANAMQMRRKCDANAMQMRCYNEREK